MITENNHLSIAEVASLKPGDKLKVRSFIDLVSNYYKFADGKLHILPDQDKIEWIKNNEIHVLGCLNIPFGFNDSMLEYCGAEITIYDIHEFSSEYGQETTHRIHIVEDGTDWAWCIDMFEPLAPKNPYKNFKYPHRVRKITSSIIEDIEEQP